MVVYFRWAFDCLLDILFFYVHLPIKSQHTDIPLQNHVFTQANDDHGTLELVFN